MTTLDTLQGRVVATVGSTANTGFVPWVVSLRVQLGPYYFVVCPLSGQRRLEVRLQLPLEVHASRVYTSTATSLSATKTTTAAIRTTAVATTTTTTTTTSSKSKNLKLPARQIEAHWIQRRRLTDTTPPSPHVSGVGSQRYSNARRPRYSGWPIRQRLRHSRSLCYLPPSTSTSRWVRHSPLPGPVPASKGAYTGEFERATKYFRFLNHVLYIVFLFDICAATACLLRAQGQNHSSEPVGVEGRDAALRGGQ